MTSSSAITFFGDIIRADLTADVDVCAGLAVDMDLPNFHLK